MEPAKRARIRNGLALAAFLALVGWTAWQTSKRPVRNWDMLCYMALALEWGEDDPVEVHRLTYEAAQERLPPRFYQNLLFGGFQVRAARYQDPAAFTEHLAFYRARVLYTLPLFLAQRMGAPLVDATWWLSIASWVGLALLTLAWTRRCLPFPAAAALAAVVVHVPPVLDAARFSTPDALTTLLTCGGIYCLAVRRSLLCGAAILTGSLFVRPDNVILIVLLIATLFLVDEREARPSLRFSAAWLVLSVALYLGLSKWSGHYGWWPVFWITMVQKEVYPSRIPTAMDAEVYWEAFKAKSARVLGTADVYWAGAYAGFAALALALWARAGRPACNRRHAAILLALLATFVVRYPLFPQLWARFLAPLYVLVPLLLMTMLVEARKSRSAPLHEDVLAG